MSYNPNNPNGSATSANSAPVVIASDQAAVTVKNATAANLKVDGSAVTQPVSAASLPLPTGAMTDASGATIYGNQTNGTQQTKITDGTNTVNVLKSDGTAAGQNASLTAGTYLSVPFTTTTVQAVGSTDAGNYKSVSVHITSQGGSSTVNYQGSNDNTNWVSVSMTSAGLVNSTAQSTSDTISGVIRAGNLKYRYFRLNVTGIASGTTAGTIVFSVFPIQENLSSIQPTSPTGSAVPANAFYIAGIDGSGLLQGFRTASAQVDASAGANLAIGAGMVYNGSGFDRIRSASSAKGTTGTGVLAAGALGFDGTNYQAIKTSTTGVVSVDGSAVTQPVSGTVTANTPLPAAAALADGASNPTVPAVGAFGMVYNGASWERMRGDLGDGSGATGLLVNSSLVYNGSTYDRIRSASGAPIGTLAVTDQPTTSGGLSFKSASLNATVTAVKTSAGQLYGYHFFNTTAAVAYVQIFNVATGSVTLGTTVPDLSIGLPPSGGVTVNFDKGVAFGTAISVASTTTRTGSTAAGVDANFFYK